MAPMAWSPARRSNVGNQGCEPRRLRHPKSNHLRDGTLFGRNRRLFQYSSSLGFAEAEGIAPDLPRLTKPFRQPELAASVTGLAGSRAGAPALEYRTCAVAWLLS